MSAAVRIHVSRDFHNWFKQKDAAGEKKRGAIKNKIQQTSKLTQNMHGYKRNNRAKTKYKKQAHKEDTILA